MASLVLKSLPMTLLATACGEATGATGATVTRVYRSANAPAPVTVDLWLPPGYDDDGRRRWPTVHVVTGSAYGGQWLFRAVAKGVREERMPPMVVAAIRPGAWTRSADACAVVAEVIGRVDADYRTQPDRTGRAIEGAGAGGAVAMATALRHPDRFCSLLVYGGGLSAAGSPHLPAGAELLDRSTRQVRQNLTVKLLVGQDDPAIGDVVAARDLLRSYRVPHAYEILGGVGGGARGYYRTAGLDGMRFHADNFEMSVRQDEAARTDR